MRSLAALALSMLLVGPASSGCLVAIGDRPFSDVGPGSDGEADAEPDGEATDGGPQLDAFWPYEHRPEDCPEEAARAREVCDPRCDGVSHFYCAEEPSDPCCACLRLAGGSGGSGGSGGGLPDDPRGPGNPGGGGGDDPPRPPPSPR